MGEVMDLLEKVKEIQEEKYEEKKKYKILTLDHDVEFSFRFPNILDKLIDTNYNFEFNDLSEIQVDLFLYCILVNSLFKTKGERFDQVKKEMQILIKILKDLYCEFDNNELHKERTFIFALRSPAGLSVGYINF